MADEHMPGNGGMIERLRNSPRTISTIIVILIIAGAIFAFSDREEGEPSPSPAEGTPAPTEQPSSPEPTATAQTGGATTAQPTATPLPEPSETADAYTEVVARGQGRTHLARKAAGRYLEANKDESITNEHRIFIEDYVKDRMERTPLHVGNTRTIEKNLIREAVDASKKLSDAQLKHLQTYSRRVQWQ